MINVGEKLFVRTLWGEDKKHGWVNEAQRNDIKEYLNDQGFYVLSGPGNSLDVFVMQYDNEPIDIKYTVRLINFFVNQWKKYKS